MAGVLAIRRGPLAPAVRMRRAQLRACLPAPVLARLRGAREGFRMSCLIADWLRIRGEPAGGRQPGAPRNPLILPGDPATLTDSLGDEAMLRAVLQVAASLVPPARCHVLVTRREGERRAEELGLVPVRIPEGAGFLPALKARLAAHGIDAAAALGADAVDGSYDVLAAIRMLLALDLATRMGLPAAVLGCSFTRRPSWLQRRLWPPLDPRIHFHLRDADSLRRFTDHTRRAGRLVADVAFLLEPAAPDPAARAWIEAQRAAGRAVLGLNLHPTLLGIAEMDPSGPAAGDLVAMLADFARTEQVAWLLVVHDHRGAYGDGALLGPWARTLAGRIGDQVRYLDGGVPSDSIKGLLGHLDGVVSGRMHLAIGALGMGVPVLAIVYQDKFQGLFRHFGLGEELLLDPQLLQRPAALREAIQAFLGRRDALRAQIASRLPAVRELAARKLTQWHPGPRR